MASRIIRQIVNAKTQGQISSFLDLEEISSSNATEDESII
jgi:hypothetical protein